LLVGRFCCFIVPILCGTAILTSAGWCWADEATDISRVEEYWEVDLDTPDAARGTPQLNFLISPTGASNGLHAVFTVNHRDGSIGGLQLQLWNGESLVASSTFSDTAALGTTGEKLSWKTRIEVEDGNLTVEIVGLNSTTWGNTGANSVVSDLSVSTATSIANLNNYDLNVSAANFGIDFGTTRVAKVVLKKVVSFVGNKKDEVDQLGSERVIYSHQ
jgi:hypothetical protein